MRIITPRRKNQRSTGEELQAVDPAELMDDRGRIKPAIVGLQPFKKRGDNSIRIRARANVNPLDDELACRHHNPEPELLRRVIVSPFACKLERRCCNCGCLEMVGISPVDVHRGCGLRLQVEGSYNYIPGAGTAECPKEVWVRDGGNKIGGAVREDDVECNNRVGAEPPVP